MADGEAYFFMSLSNLFFIENLYLVNVYMFGPNKKKIILRMKFQAKVCPTVVAP